MELMQWLLDALGVPKEWTWIQFLNSQFLSTLVGAIVAIVVARSGTKVSNAASEAATAQQVATTMAQAKRYEDQEEVVEVRELSSEETNYREDARKLIQKAKEFLDGKANQDPDGRHQRTYQALGRYDYVPLAVALNDRKQISADQLNGAVRLFTNWKAYERGRAAKKSVPKEVYDQMSEAFKTLTGSQHNPAFDG